MLDTLHAHIVLDPTRMVALEEFFPRRISQFCVLLDEIMASVQNVDQPQEKCKDGGTGKDTAQTDAQSDIKSELNDDPMETEKETEKVPKPAADEVESVAVFDREAGSSGRFEFIYLDDYQIIVERVDERPENQITSATDPRLLQKDPVPGTNPGGALQHLRNRYVEYVVEAKREGKTPRTLRDLAGEAFPQVLRLLRHLQKHCGREKIDDSARDSVLLREIDMCTELGKRKEKEAARKAQREKRRLERNKRKRQKDSELKRSKAPEVGAENPLKLCRICSRTGHRATKCGP